jgi:hypothetical protein
VLSAQQRKTRRQKRNGIPYHRRGRFVEENVAVSSDQMLLS